MNKVKLGEICSFRTGKLNSNAAIPNGIYPFFTCAQETYYINEAAFDTEAVLLGGNNANGVYPLKYYNGKFNAYQRTYIIEPLDQKILNIRFIYYALLLALDSFQKHSIGSATQYLTKPILEKFLIDLPELEKQNVIVTILSNYDDLIQTNQRRIALLEEAAQRLYDEWFVKLRFPNHEQVPVVDGVPEGWERVYLSEIADINANTIKKDEFEYINYVDISSVEERKIQNQTTVSIKEAAGRAKRKVNHGDIIWSCVRPNRRQFSIIWQPANNLIVSTGFSTLSAKNVPFTYLYLLSDNKLFSDYLENVATGSAYPAVTASDFEAYETLKPNEDLLLKFDKIALPLVEQAENLKLMNQKLTQARDELLPRLMSGQLDVSKLLEPETV